MNSFARAVISSCIQNIKSSKCVIHNINVEFITNSLVDLFRHKSRHVNAKKFYLLNARFQKIFDAQQNIDSNTTFRTNLMIFKEVRDLSLISLVNFITNENLRNFEHNNALQLFNAWMHFLRRSWHHRSEDTIECLRKNLKYVDSFVEIATISWLQTSL